MELHTGELRRAGVLVHLPPQPYKVLVLLASRSGQLITREEIRQVIWGNDTFVDFEHGLNFAIKKIRDALGDDAESPRFIQTLPRRGYRFIAQVRLSGPPVRTGSPAIESSHASAQTAVQETTQIPRRVDTRPSISARHRLYASVLLGALILTAVIVFAVDPAGLRYRTLAALHLEKSQAQPHIDSIAVLPLENLSGDPEQEYFADGLTDTLITNLGQVLTMRVISRASVLRYKRGKTPLPEIARELNVDAVVEGTVLRAGNKVRISVQLLNARTDRHLWAETYERNLEDVIVLERQMALAIAHEISGRLNPGQEMHLNSGRPVNPHAYDAYVRGRVLFGERTAETETNARSYFEEALRADPNFAPAYSGLADFYSVSWHTTSDFPLAEQYARKSIALDPDLAEGHASLGIAQLGQHKFIDAETELKKAIELNSNYAMAHHLMADYWMDMGRITDALAENDRARQLDPFSFPINFMRGGILAYSGDTERAVQQLQFVSSINPQSPSPHELLALVYWINGKVPAALIEEKQIGALGHDPQLINDADRIARVYSKSGLHSALREDILLRENAHARTSHGDQMTHGFYTSISIASQYAILGDRDRTLHWINEAMHEELDHSPEDLMCAPQFSFVRSDPRFQAILRTFGLPLR
ncbi:winged helix-turn-helix domain-containing protein [Telmatobacter sp. DSM 110680]|uniref:Winged helix-turn-helix domain-containing protein n=1 Tax=Telmatobacter sp. DSM 110680 TaxID=3036704 RepID=A0AAU7DF66_9BACT